MSSVCVSDELNIGHKMYLRILLLKTHCNNGKIR
jgi:hypothetical protein